MADNGKPLFDAPGSFSTAEPGKKPDPKTPVTVEMLEQYVLGAFHKYAEQYGFFIKSAQMGPDGKPILKDGKPLVQIIPVAQMVTNMAKMLSAYAECWEIGVPVDQDGKVVLNQQMMDLLLPKEMPQAN